VPKLPVKFENHGTMPGRKHLFIIFLLALSQFIRAGSPVNKLDKNNSVKSEKVNSMKNNLEGMKNFRTL
jgi:hypothetical protein